MWSVRLALVGFYFGFFTLAIVLGNAFIVWYEVNVITADGAPETLIGIIQGVGWVGLASAIGIFTLTEIVENAMVMANWIRQNYLEPLKERQREEGRAKGLEEGRQEGREQGLEEGRQEGRERGRAEGEREALARIRSEMHKRGIKLTEEDEDALFNPNGHSR